MSSVSIFFWLSNKERNRLVRAITGNRQNRGIKLAHWNAGSAHLANKMMEIEHWCQQINPIYLESVKPILRWSMILRMSNYQNMTLY